MLYMNKIIISNSINSPQTDMIFACTILSLNLFVNVLYVWINFMYYIFYLQQSIGIMSIFTNKSQIG